MLVFSTSRQDFTPQQTEQWAELLASFERLFDRPEYRQRDIIERMFGWLKENCRIVTRFDKLEKNYAAMISPPCSMQCLRHIFSYRAYVKRIVGDAAAETLVAEGKAENDARHIVGKVNC